MIPAAIALLLMNERLEFELVMGREVGDLEIKLEGECSE